MQPKPMAETVSPLFPSCRWFMRFHLPIYKGYLPPGDNECLKERMRAGDDG
jgi:hypothetical protein